MPQRENRARVNDTTMQNSFQQGFQEGLQVAGAVWVYEVEFFFEGTKLRMVQFSDQSQALSEVVAHLLNGPETEVRISVTITSAQQSTTSQAAVGSGDDDVVDAEVVDEK